MDSSIPLSKARIWGTAVLYHSGASRITVSGTAKLGKDFEISINDNGSVLPEELRRGRGLTSMETRTRKLGGVLSIQSGSDGTSLTLSIPCAAAYG
jgi:two-component system, NarL family, sensor histidine kinase UhpB